MNKDELQEQILQIEENLAQMESQLQDFNNLTDSEKSELIQKMDTLKEAFEKKISDLEKNIIQLNDSAIEPSAIEDLEEKLEEIVKVLKQKASEHYDVDYNKGLNVKNDENQEMLAEGQDVFNEGMELANNMLKNLKEANTMMIDIESEIYEQRMKLIRTKETLKEAQNLTNRTKELVGYFSNQMAKDKCFKIMIGIMAVLLVGCIIMLYFYKDQIGIESQLERDELVNENKEFEFDENGNIILNKDEIQEYNQDLLGNVGLSQQEKKKQELLKIQLELQKQKQAEKENKQTDQTKDKNRIKRNRKLLNIKPKRKRKHKKQFQKFTEEDMNDINYFQNYFDFNLNHDDVPLI